jgi:hypothetical protein
MFSSDFGGFCDDDPGLDLSSERSGTAAVSSLSVEKLSNDVLDGAEMILSVLIASSVGTTDSLSSTRFPLTSTDACAAPMLRHKEHANMSVHKRLYFPRYGLFGEPRLCRRCPGAGMQVKTKKKMWGRKRRGNSWGRQLVELLAFYTSHVYKCIGA